MITVGFNKIIIEEDIALGNHMFQYSICRLVAERNNYNFFIPYPGYLNKCFPGIELGIKDGEILYQYNEPQISYNPEIFNVPNFTNLSGFFQTDKYFQGNEEFVKSWFKMDDSDVKSVIDKYPIDDFCYMHIRGTGNSGGNIRLKTDYYLRAMDEVRKIKSDISFVIITDDVSLSKSYFPDIDVLSDDVMVDFKSLYFSKYCIISNSTFAWWASWLSNKIVTIAPDRWYNHNSPSLDSFPIDIKTDKFIFI